MSAAPDDCGCPSTASLPATGGLHHAILTVNDLVRSRRFYDRLMPRLGYPGVTGGEGFAGWYGPGGSFWIKQAAPRFAGDVFSKDRVGLCELVQHLAIYDYLCVGASMEGRMIEYVDHLHEHFTDPVVVEHGHYRLPQRPGYSAEMHAGSVRRYAFPGGEAWAGRHRSGRG